MSQASLCWSISLFFICLSCSHFNRDPGKFEFHCMSLSVQSAITHVNQCSSLKLCSSGCSAVEGCVWVVGRIMAFGVIGHRLHRWGRESWEWVKTCHSTCVSAGVSLWKAVYRVITFQLLQAPTGEWIDLLSSVVDNRWRKLWDKSSAGHVEWQLIF